MLGRWAPQMTHAHVSGIHHSPPAQFPCGIRVLFLNTSQRSVALGPGPLPLIPGQASGENPGLLGEEGNWSECSNIFKAMQPPEHNLNFRWHLLHQRDDFWWGGGMWFPLVPALSLSPLAVSRGVPQTKGKTSGWDLLTRWLGSDSEQHTAWALAQPGLPQLWPGGTKAFALGVRSPVPAPGSSSSSAH